jgi:hypothetical protein
MNENFKKLAEEAGFVFWGSEKWKPEGAVIDWSCNYEEEFKKFGELVVQECAKELIKWKDEPFPYDPGFGAILIKSLFGVK